MKTTRYDLALAAATLILLACIPLAIELLRL
jgi:hypothetical protein